MVAASLKAVAELQSRASLQEIRKREIIGALIPFEIEVHDHLIAGTGSVPSFRSAGLI